MTDEDDPPPIDVGDPTPPDGYTQAQWEVMRLQLSHPKARGRTLPLRRLIEFRCQQGSGKGGHLLAVVYQSPSGPLAVSMAEMLRDAESRQRRRDWAVKSGYADFKRPAWNPSPRLIDVDERFSDDPFPISCRCGDWPSLSRDNLKSALTLMRATDSRRPGPLVIGVSKRGLHSAGSTLCLF